ncbi:hypothetical protein MKEN_00375900 [Mycena kentingensis (nom. inval.)]|nr:hypothetical protein MKEN_00375900 [Mycena kentingensis (nom. inval.)]
MKPLHLLLLLAAAAGSYAQSSDPNSAPSQPPASSDPPTTPSNPVPSDPVVTPSTPAVSPSAPPSEPAQPSTTPPPNTEQESESVFQSLTTGADGLTSTVNVTSTFTSQPSSSATSAVPDTNKDDSDDGPALSTGGIIGLAVAGGVSLLCVAGFFIWKCTRKNSSGFDDNEAIKWPELNAHGDGGGAHALPTHDTGRAGFDTGNDLSRVPSAANTFSNSTDYHPDDPYAVPPLPHNNPNQAVPYRDDVYAQNPALYDPYNGPVPQTFNEAAGPAPQEWGHEAIPMTQMRTGSPGPQQAYAAAGRTPSPGPQMAYNTGRASPAPGGYGRASPAPQQIYRQGSPGPQQAYAAAGRTPSPGPQAAYGYGGM